MAAYLRACGSDRFVPGTLHLHRVENGPLIVNMATKADWRRPSRLSWAGAGLIFLSKLLQDRLAGNPAPELAVTLPPPGCGHGGLDLQTVQAMIRAYLQPVLAAGVRVTVTTTELPMAARPAIYAGVGARETPDGVLDLMKSVAGLMEGQGALLRSGGARGADSAFESGVRDPAMAEIYVADGKARRKHPNAILSHETLHDRMVDMVHPAPRTLSPFVRSLMARNGCQIFGEDFSRPTDVVICWTREGAGGGGTGQAIRLARTVGIPVLDLGDRAFRDMTAAEVAGTAAEMILRRRCDIGLPVPGEDRSPELMTSDAGPHPPS